jgi:hypothetical protein
MSKIHTITDYKFPVLCAETIVLDETEETDTEFMLKPYSTYKEGVYKYLVYKVTTQGKTLREFITEVNKQPIRTSFRSSIRKREHKLNPLELLLKLIDICEGLLVRNKLLSQSHINPDLLWVDFDKNNNIQIKLLDILDCDVANENIKETLYLSPELLGKRNHALYNKTDTKKISLNRYDTRPSTLSSVYSIGLVLYFIVSNADPYEGSRVDVNERPHLNEIQPTYAKLIWIATNADPKERPTLSEYRDIATNMLNPIKGSCMGMF